MVGRFLAGETEDQKLTKGASRILRDADVDVVDVTWNTSVVEGDKSRD